MNRRDRRNRLDDIASVSATLRGDVRSAPDLTDEILSRVNEQRPFLDRASRRWVIGSRLLACSVLICGGLFVAAVNRWAPDSLDLAPPDRPVSAVVSALAASTTQFTTFPDAMGELLVVNPAVIEQAAPRRVYATGMAQADLGKAMVAIGSSGELTARCFVGPVIDRRFSDVSSTLPSIANSTPPITLARAAPREVSSRPTSIAAADRGWFEPVPLRTTANGLVRVSLPARPTAEPLPTTRTWSPSAVDIFSPR